MELPKIQLRRGGKMKKVLLAVVFSLLIMGLMVSPAMAAKGVKPITIQSGLLTDSVGNPITLGYDQFGYNYQAHMFNGTYDSSDRVLDGTYWGQTGDYVDDTLIMKWSDPWLANVDTNGDFKLDRGLVNGVASLTDTSMGWLTNHNEGDYDSDGNGTQDAHYTYFCKIVWVGPGGSLWGEYEIIQEVWNDPVGGFHGLQLKIGAPGFGLNNHWTTN
jgi:hypothetical protein